MDIVRILLRNDANVSILDNYGNTALMKAVLAGHDVIVKEIVEYLELKAKHDADKLKTIEEIKDVVNNQLAGVPPWREYMNQKNMSGYTAFMLALSHQKDDIVKYLLGKECEVTSRAKNGRTPLIEASEWGQAVVVKQILDLLAKTDKLETNSGPCYQMPDTGRTALMQVVEKFLSGPQGSAGYMDTITLLCDAVDCTTNESSINVKDNVGDTSLLLVCRDKGKSEAVLSARRLCARLLLEKGAESVINKVSEQ